VFAHRKHSKKHLQKKLTVGEVQAVSEQINTTKADDSIIAMAAIERTGYTPTKTKGIDQINSKNLVKEFDIKELTENHGKDITLDCCVHKVRSMGKIKFIIVRTGRFVLQSVYSEANCSDSVVGIKEGCFVRISGTIHPSDKALHGAEILLKSVKLISMPKAEYPLHVSQPRLGCSIDVNLNNRSVALRNPYERAIFKLQEGVCEGFRRFMLSQNFTEIHSPKIVAQGAEGGANIFHFEYFGKRAFLNQSPQFYKQTAIAFFDRVFEVAPVYRAEKHATSRHINEYIGLDFEMGYIDSMYDVMAMETAMLKSVMDFLRENYAPEIETLGADIPVIDEIPCVTLLEAKTLLGDKASGNKLDLEPEDEVNLCEYAKKRIQQRFHICYSLPRCKTTFLCYDFT